MWLILIFSFIGVILTTNVKAQQNNIRNYFLVDTIYSENNNLLIRYIYDSENKLIKSISTDQIIESYRTIDRTRIDSFIYNDGLVAKIMTYKRYKDSYFGHDDESYFVQDSFEYDLHGNLIKTEDYEFIYKNGNVASASSFYLDSCFYGDTVIYNDLMNVTKYIIVSPQLDLTGQPMPCTYMERKFNYEFDNNPKPNFGLDYLFIYNPIKKNKRLNLISGLSDNNMINAEEDRYKWIYTYYKNGLPATIETKWIGIETLNPMILRIKYKQISEVGVPDEKHKRNEITMYPNPATDNITISSAHSIIRNIEIYDLLVNCLFQSGSIDKQNFLLNLSEFPSGIYILKAETDQAQVLRKIIIN